MLSFLGATGAGMVWGWLAIQVLGRAAPRRPLAGFLGGAVVTLFLCLQYLSQVDWAAAAFFGGATGGAAVLHLGWLRSLRPR